MKFAILASGSKGNATLVRSKQTCILIDCGMTQRYLKQAFELINFDLNRLDALLITHTHKDHVGAIKLFKNVPTYASVDSALETKIGLEPLKSIMIGDIEVLPIPSSHDSDGALGYVLKCEDETLVYLTDTGYVAQNLYPYLQNAHSYILESNHDVEMLMDTNRPWHVKQRIISDVGHLCNEDSAYLLSQIVGDNTREVILAHISEEGNTPDLALNTLTQVFDDLAKPINFKVSVAKQYEVIVGGCVND